MSSATAAPPPSPASRQRSLTAWLLSAALIAAIVFAYANTVAAPFVFDDVAAVTQNPSLAHFSTALNPPPGLSVTGRPLVNLSLWFNHALSGEAVWSYHALNLALHAANALLLFALLCRIFQTFNFQPSTFNRDAVAFATASLWSLHPLQTAAVTYVMQRSELLATLCLLLTLFAFVRSRPCPRHRLNEPGSDAASRAGSTVARSPSSALWLTLSVLACLLGMAAKEIAVVIPFVVLLYDRTFVAGAFTAALRARPRYYAALIATWLLLAALTLGTDNRGASAGLASGMSWTGYALTQIHAFALYLRLALWPAPLVFDYGTGLVESASALALPAALLLALVAATVLALRRRSALGFAGALGFVLLAPTSSIVPIATQTIAEHRLYLALVVPLALVVLTLQRWLRGAFLFVVLPLALCLGAVTFVRNAVYASAISLWSDTVAKRPANARAHYNLGISLLAPGATRDPARAVTELSTALQLEPTHALAPAKLGAALLELGRFAAAVPPLETALRLRPTDATLHYQLAGALLATGRTADALPHLAESVRLNPGHAAAHYNYGRALTDLSRYPEALGEFDEAARLDPTDESARNNASRLRAFLQNPAPR